MIIYKTTNLINGKIYVGQDSNNDPDYLGSGVYICNAIKKYGKENFKKEVLCECLDQKDLNEKEIYWIKSLNSKDPNGYNLTDGGHGGGLLGWIPSKETREKMSKSKKGTKVGKQNHMFGKKHSKESIEKMRKIKAGCNNPMFGKSASKETKEKISISNTGKIRTEEVKLKIKIFNLGKHASKETKEKMRNSRKGKPSGMKGKTHSEETKLKMKESQLLRWKNK